ncbi:MAG: hypothetical protein EXX96DRAFT_565729 [Benjaminiella poitrasii]|nr:MAG: hypothetical protein EXX96DRAFT_565729 [Benjaminiella poitrasii]
MNTDQLYYDAPLYEDHHQVSSPSNFKFPIHASCEFTSTSEHSCDTLTAAFSHTSLDNSSCVFDDDDDNDMENRMTDTEDNDQDVDDEYTNPSPETVLFFEILLDFPDLATFVCHPDFWSFARIWLTLQRKAQLARLPENREEVQAWLKTAALQIHYLMVTIVKSNPGNKDPNSLPRCMFSAFRRLKDRVEILYQVFQIIENGRVLHGQGPSEAIAPLLEAAGEIRTNLDYFVKNPHMIPVMNDKTNRVDLTPSEQVSMEALSSQLMETYNMMSYQENDTDTLVVGNEGPQVTPSSKTGTSLEPASLHHESPLKSSNHLIAPLNQVASEPPVPNHVYPAEYFHIHPSWLHSTAFSTWSVPVTPTMVEIQPFLSLPVTPSYVHLNEDTTYSPYTRGSSPIVNSPYNTLSENNSEEEEFDEFDLPEDIKIKDEDDDEDYVEPEEEERAPSPPLRRRSKRMMALKKLQAPKLTTSSATATIPDPTSASDTAPQTRRKRKVITNFRQYTRRTATSYDARTTHYLKSVFFNIYSSRDKLTKEQRRQVQKETGLKPRNITYWFSNHKRRFQTSLSVFKKVVEESEGKIKTYDDFLAWRRERGLPEEALESELMADEV